MRVQKYEKAMQMDFLLKKRKADKEAGIINQSN